MFGDQPFSGMMGEEVVKYVCFCMVIELQWFSALLIITCLLFLNFTK